MGLFFVIIGAVVDAVHTLAYLVVKISTESRDIFIQKFMCIISLRWKIYDSKRQFQKRQSAIENAIYEVFQGSQFTWPTIELILDFSGDFIAIKDFPSVESNLISSFLCIMFSIVKNYV